MVSVTFWTTKLSGTLMIERLTLPAVGPPMVGGVGSADLNVTIVVPADGSPRSTSSPAFSFVSIASPVIDLTVEASVTRYVPLSC